MEGIRNSEFGIRDSEFGIMNAARPPVLFEFSILNSQFLMPFHLPRFSGRVGGIQN